MIPNKMRSPPTINLQRLCSLAFIKNKKAKVPHLTIIHCDIKAPGLRPTTALPAPARRGKFRVGKSRGLRSCSGHENS